VPRTALLPVGALVLFGLLVAGCAGSTYEYRPELIVNSLIHPDEAIQHGLALTISVSIVSQILGVVLGIFAALGKMSRILPFRWLASFYIWVFRGTPLIIQLAFFFYGLGVTQIYKWPDITIGGFTLEGALQAGILALGVNEGAYMAEIVRAGILSIDPGQSEAAKALGMTYGLTMRRIVLPQAARVIIPPLGNEFNNMLKTTSLLFVLGVEELYTTFNLKQGNEFAPFEYFLAAAIWFLILTTIWGFFQARIEKRFSKGAAGSGSLNQPGLRARLFGLTNRSGQQIGTHG
jgi:polar amino acid transport system permease protein